ncbi:GNAT family N-acetyltransferase [Mycobacterium sp. Aquia_216]|uniref:GNAT family N-acetyltransferase n=1 Tax=Mycobacterium sp. Aquia_216 TaxID=2991729 RepID=UPI00227B1077|nr:GNAT family N-acetyltransferase [Mycobacterium sp. Aquia_216]WAJ46986.1 GNAT family N-acetyltransferase [Mycobacterium sp. Aquia_216]
MKSKDVKIRRAGPSDFEKVAAMHYPVWRQSLAGILEDHVLDVISTPKLWATVKYPEALNQPGWGMWVAEARGRLLGMTVFGPDAANPDDLKIDALYTAEEAKGLGVGVRLLNKAVRSNPSGDVILWCAEENAEARQFYEDNDFQLDDRSLDWVPLPGVRVSHVGYRRRQSAPEG